LAVVVESLSHSMWNSQHPLMSMTRHVEHHPSGPIAVTCRWSNWFEHAL